MKLLTDKEKYAEAETIQITLEVENVSTGDVVLESRLPPTPYTGSFMMDNLAGSTKPRTLAELCFYAPGDDRLFFVHPIGEKPKGQLTLRPGQRQTFRYEVPAFRVVLYSEYGNTCPCEVRGPWFSGVDAERRKELVVIPEYQPVNIGDPHGLFDKAFDEKYVRPNVFKTFRGEHVLEAGKYRPVATMQDLSPQECNELSQLEPVRRFAEKHGRFDALCFTHVYITGGGFYGERIVILSTLGPAIETLLVRTWQGIKDCDPRVIEVFTLHSNKVNEPGAERFRVEYQPPLDFGSTKVYDNLSGELIFSAGSVWAGTGCLSVPRKVDREEIHQLHAKQSAIMKEASRYVSAELKGPLDEMERFLHAKRIRIRAVNDFGALSVDLALTIPPQSVRADVIAALKQNEHLRILGE
ncbi:MAG TPA: hypothetical protein VMV94_12560 [Phycisphaerae bacterium]|nr:hypothetical protein [Phycisphaerae bacterium]